MNLKRRHKTGDREEREGGRVRSRRRGERLGTQQEQRHRVGFLKRREERRERERQEARRKTGRKALLSIGGVGAGVAGFFGLKRWRGRSPVAAPEDQGAQPAPGDLDEPTSQEDQRDTSGAD